MGKIVVINCITLDGVMQAPGGPDEDARGGFTQDGWAVAYQDVVMARKMGELMAGANGYLFVFGSRIASHQHPG